MTFGKKIREARKRKDWSVYNLAEAIHDEENKSKTAGYVSKIEVRGEIPSPYMIMELAKILGLDSEELFELAKNEKKQQLTQTLDRKYDHKDVLTLYRKTKKK